MQLQLVSQLFKNPGLPSTTISPITDDGKKRCLGSAGYDHHLTTTNLAFVTFPSFVIPHFQSIVTSALSFLCWYSLLFSDPSDPFRTLPFKVIPSIDVFIFLFATCTFDIVAFVNVRVSAPYVITGYMYKNYTFYIDRQLIFEDISSFSISQKKLTPEKFYFGYPYLYWSYIDIPIGCFCNHWNYFHVLLALFRTWRRWLFSLSNTYYW